MCLAPLVSTIFPTWKRKIHPSGKFDELVSVVHCHGIPRRKFSHIDEITFSFWFRAAFNYSSSSFSANGIQNVGTAPCPIKISPNVFQCTTISFEKNKTLVAGLNSHHTLHRLIFSHRKDVSTKTARKQWVVHWIYTFRRNKTGSLQTAIKVLELIVDQKLNVNVALVKQGNSAFREIFKLEENISDILFLSCNSMICVCEHFLPGTAYEKNIWKVNRNIEWERRELHLIKL